MLFRSGYVTLTIQSRVSDAYYTITLLVVDHITDQLPTRVIHASFGDRFTNLPLADDYWCSPGNIDAILGAQMFAFTILGGRVIPPPVACTADSPVSSRSAPYALETTLGYVIMSEMPAVNPDGIVWFFGPLVNDLRKYIEKFWELPSNEFISPENQDCEQFYTSTVKRNSCGRYIVSLPFPDCSHYCVKIMAANIKHCCSIQKCDGYLGVKR